jgi:signal peptidase II
MNESGEARVGGTKPSSAATSGWRWLPIAGAVMVLDQATKAWVLSAFREFERLELLPVLDFTLLYNTGAAFSFLAGASGWQRWFFVLLALTVAVGIVAWLRALPAGEQPRLGVGLALILGGALGNVVDRLRLGKVVDFVHVHWNDACFPAFNVADSAITIGAGVLLLDALLESRRSRSSR